MSTVIETHAQQAANEIADMFVMGFCDDRMVADISSIIQKHNERIVRECAGICTEMAAKCAGLPGDGALARDCADWIKKDFGVV